MANILADCVCGQQRYPLSGRPSCVKKMSDHLFYIFRPRFKADGTRNTLDINDPTLGATIKALIQQATAEDLRIYPTAEVHDFEPTVTEDKFQTTARDKKFRIDNVGEVYTWAGMFLSDDATFRAYDEINTVRCNETDVWVVDTNLSVWMVLPDFNTTITQGIAISNESFTRSYQFAKGDTINGIPFAFDLDSKKDIGCMIPITSEEHGLTADDFKGLRPVDATLTPLTASTMTLQLVDPYLTPASGNGVLGITDAEIVFNDISTGTPVLVPGTTVEVGGGDYTFTSTAPMTTGANIKETTTPVTLVDYFFQEPTAISL